MLIVCNDITLTYSPDDDDSKRVNSRETAE